jgi:hypothetical protein
MSADSKEAAPTKKRLQRLKRLTRTTDEVAADIRQRITIADLGRKFFPGWKSGKSCRSPFREDRNPSFSVYGNGTRFKDFATDDHGDVFDFYQLAIGCDRKQAFIELKELALGREPNVAAPIIRVPSTPKLEEKRTLFHPELEKPTNDELDTIWRLRGIGIEGLQLAVSRGFLWMATLHGHRAYVLTDRRRNVYLTRRLDGQPWEHLETKPKAYTLPGGQANWPIGIEESASYPAIALCEGAPDFLAAFGHAWASGVENRVAPMCLAAASVKITDDALPYFKDKSVRVFVHNDSAGRGACARWQKQLLAVTDRLSYYHFDGLIQADGSSVADLNDLLRVDYDCWEANREIIESIMNFTQENNYGGRN